jgi:ribonuclease G
MDVRLIISASKNIIISFLLNGKDIREVKVEKRTGKRVVGSIFKGKIKKIAKSLDGAFVDLGMEREAYLPFKDLPTDMKENYPPKIGSSLLVQVRREPINDKGAKVSGRISIPGKFLIYLPNSEGVFVSSKILSEEERERYLRIFNGILNNDGVIDSHIPLKRSSSCIRISSWMSAA